MIYAVVFATGAVIMIIELLGTRILSPFYGMTLYVWASMISTALIFLALGYFIGGYAADRKPTYENFYSLVFASGVSILLIPLLSKNVLLATNVLGVRFGSLVCSIILFALQFTLLGAVAPYAIRLKMKDIKRTGSTAGSLYAVATIGSFLGTVMTGFYLIPNFGIRVIIYLTSSLLIAISAAWFLVNKKYKMHLLIPLIFLIVQPSTVKPHEVLYNTDSMYGQVKVVEKEGNRYLLVNGAPQSCLHDGKPCLKYLYLMSFSAALFEETPKNALVLGLGGGVNTRDLLGAGISTETVEINDKVVKAAREYFNFSGNVVVDDARYFVRTSNKKYDLVLLDAFDVFVLPPHLFTAESFREVRGILTDDGIFVLNILGWVEDENILTKSIHRTLKQIFPYVYVVPLDPKGFSNIILFASDRPLELSSYPIEEDGIIITDEYTPLEFWAIRGSETGRETILKYFGSEILLY